MVIVNIPSEFFDETDPRVGEDEQPNEGGLDVLRVRYYYDFKTSFFFDCKKEILFYNSSETTFSSIEFDLGEFLENLHIYDSDKKSLEFHKNISEYTGNNECQDDTIIVIDLPQDRQINPREYRTIEFSYIRTVEDYVKNVKYFNFAFDLSESYRTYITIHSFSKFKMIKHYFIQGSDDSLFSFDDLNEIEDITVYSDDSSVTLSSGRTIPDCYALFAFRYDIQKTQRWWLRLGVALGTITFFVDLGVLILDPSRIWNIIIPSVGLVNAFLLIIKGWLFQNDMERILGDKYDIIYVLLISALILLVVLTFISTTLINHVFLSMNVTFISLINSSIFNTTNLLS